MLTASDLTYTVFELLPLIDGKNSGITVKEVKDLLGLKKDIFDFLEKKFPKDVDFSLLDIEARNFMIGHFDEIGNAGKMCLSMIMLFPEKFN